MKNRTSGNVGLSLLVWLVCCLTLAGACWAAEPQKSASPLIQQVVPATTDVKPVSDLTPALQKEIKDHPSSQQKVKPGLSISGSATPASGRRLTTEPQKRSEELSISGGKAATLPVPQKAAVQAVDLPQIAEGSLASLFVTHPKQGDFMVEGGEFTLQWSAVGNIPQKCVNIDLFKGIFHIQPIARSVCVNGYNWQLPPGVSGNDYEIRIRTLDNAYSDDSDPFPILTSLPDLRISNLHIQPANPDMRDAITVSGVIQNDGHGTAPSSKASVKMTSGIWMSPVHVLDVPTLSFGPYGHLPFSVTFDPVVVSELTVSVNLDTHNQVTEADEGNNLTQLTFPLVKLSNLKVCVNDEIYNTLGQTKIPILIKNYSFVPVGPTVCRSWVSNHGSENHNVPALGAFESHTVYRSERFKVAGWRSYSAEVDYGDIVRESYETDNIATGKVHAAGILGSHPIPSPQCN